MSKVFNMVGGGGGPSASIFVTGLSETDTVTATNGSKTLNGEWSTTKNGHLISPIRDLGTWTVTATDGIKTVTSEVLVDVITNFYIEMSYDIELLTTETWNNFVATQIINTMHLPTASEPYIEVSSRYKDSKNQGIFAIDTMNPIDLTDVSYVRFFVDFATMHNTTYIPWLSIEATKENLWTGDNGISYRITTSITNQVIDIDTRSLNGNYYIGVRSVGGYDPIGDVALKVSSIKLIYY